MFKSQKIIAEILLGTMNVKLNRCFLIQKAAIKLVCSCLTWTTMWLTCKKKNVAARGIHQNK